MPRDPDREIRTILALSLARLNETHSHFARHELLRLAWTEAIARGLSAASVRRAVDEVLARPAEIVPLGKARGEERFATIEMMRKEERLLAVAESARGDSTHALRERTVEAALRKHPGLTPEQCHAVRAMTLVDTGLGVITGLPGTGKTFTLTVIREAYEKEGYRLLGTALAGKAARGLEEGAGIKSRSVEALLRRIEATPLDEARHHARQLARAALGKPTYAFERTRLTERTVLVIDEAGMVDTAKMLRLLEHARKANAKVLLVGDPDQLQPIGPGAPLRAIAARLGDAATTLTTITLQRDEWARESILAIRRGDAEAALRAYAERGLLHVARDRARAVEDLIEVWKKEGVSRPKETLILAAHNADVDRLNRLAQEARRAAGELGGFRARPGRDYFYLGTPHVKLADGICLYEGDRVVFTRTSAIGVNNGDLGTVKKIDQVRQKLTVQFDDRKKPETISYKRYRDLVLVVRQV